MQNQTIKMKTNNNPQSTPDVSHFSASGSFDSEHALRVLRDFYLEVRREIRKNEKVVVSANCDNEMNHLHFMADGFDLAFILTERSAS